MLKTLVNEAHLRLNITTTGPLLIKSGYTTVIGADMTPVLTYRHGQQEVYLPGSSLKGVFRSHLEKVINSIKAQTACDPLSQLGSGGSQASAAIRKDDASKLYRSSCGKYLEDKAKSLSKGQNLPSHQVYADSCPTCRLFGSTSFIGRIAIDDAYLPDGAVGTSDLLEHRDGVAIDRLTGGASGSAKFDLNVVTAGTTFGTTIHLRNFEMWQLGMLFVLLQDLEDELIRIGSGRSRGLGKVKAAISEQAEGSHPGGVVLSTIRVSREKEPDSELWGLGRWLEDETSYGTKRDDLITLSPPVAHKPTGIRNSRVFIGDALKEVQEHCIDSFITRIQQWPERLANATSRR
ncbi:MAG: CRISPR-associated RAMP protein Csx7 [Ktedonobacteraceae bacterium]